MSTLSLSTSTDYSGALVFGVDHLDFTNLPSRDIVTATFKASQFNDAQISGALHVDGSDGYNRVLVNGSLFNGSGWTFSTWTASDYVKLNGTGGSDILVGTSQNDWIYGNGGSDTLQGGYGRDKVYGGDGDDTIIYKSSGEFVNGETIDGGAGTGDVLQIEGDSNTDYKFFNASVSGVETLKYVGGCRAEFQSSQLGAGGISHVSGDAAANWLDVFGTTIDMSGVTVTGFDSQWDIIQLITTKTAIGNINGGAANERIFGDSGNDTLSGNGGDDIIFGMKGADTLSGGDGDDKFAYGNSTDMVVGETLDGGAGFDWVSISRGGTHYVYNLALTSVEGLEFGTFAGQAEVAGSQIGAAAGLINQVKGNWNADTLVVYGPMADLSGVSFVNWDEAHDTVKLIGKADADNTLTGTAFGDIITGGGLNDTLNGGMGSDTIIGGLGKDIITGGNQSDFFVYTDIAESGAGAARDKIMDFSVGNDVIDLSKIDAIAGGSDDAFTFKGQDAFDGAGQIRYSITLGGNTIVEADLDGDGTADFQIALAGSLTLGFTDFIL